jgi:hypothetical protein
MYTYLGLGLGDKGSSNRVMSAAALLDFAFSTSRRHLVGIH